MNKLYKSKEYLNKKYIINQLPIHKIAKIIECSSNTIWRWLKIHNIQIRTQSEATLVPISERFWEKVDKNGPNGCWNWMASKNRGNYGQVEIGKTMERAHRISWELYNGGIPEGLHVLHKCDNPSCVNPEHLFLGTHQDNMKDMIEKGRKVILKGEKNGNAKLTEQQVLEIRQKYETGKYTQQQLSEEYNVNYSTIYGIVNKKTWKCSLKRDVVFVK